MRSKNSITIIGSRDVDRDTVRILFEQHLSPFLQQGRTWVLGGARGVDEWAMEWLVEHNETCCVVIPYTRAKLPRRTQPWLDEIEQVVELHLPKRKTAYAFRNRYMVDMSGIVFGFWSSKSGATVRTLKYALRKRREVHAIPVFTSGSNEAD
jgi:predicted Rossmann fold nucleotide-binding protein DprA/Smf involved in DNA uptake